MVLGPKIGRFTWGIFVKSAYWKSRHTAQLSPHVLSPKHKDVKPYVHLNRAL